MFSRLQLLFAFVVCATVATAQNPWSIVPESAVPIGGERRIIPRQYRTVQLNIPALESLLATAPERFTPAANANSTQLTIPMPDGTMARFRLEESPVMAAPLQARYSDIHCYSGRGIDDPTATLKCDFTPWGFHAMVLSATRGTVFIDPYSHGDREYYVVYFKSDYVRADESLFTCTAEGLPLHELQEGNPEPEFQGDCQIRRYRLALACTGEYAAFHGNTKPLVLAAMNTSMNRVNGIYENDFAVTMQLIAQNDTLIFLNAATDPYTNNDGGIMLDENRATCNARIGLANYDIGHVFSTGGGGIAGLGVVCGNSKAEGVTGSDSPIGDAFDIDYVAHEMGHQFGGNHSFNSNQGSCSGNQNNSTAMEPGSGTTIMSYAGICGSHNVQAHSDFYFHATNIQEINNYITTGTGNTCPVKITSGNTNPVVNGGADYTIPKSTPFALTATGSDVNGDTLTYCWEQMDRQTATMPPVATSTGGPLFRSFTGTTSPTRYFPRLQSIINNVNPVWEKLPGVARTLKFRVTARDNNFGGGCTNQDDVVLTVSGTAGPFLVTAPNTNIIWYAGATQTVTWDVAATNTGAVNCANVRLSLSTDGGFTYPIVLAASVPNNGSALVTVPNIGSTTCRVKAEGVGNIFFDISNQNFRIIANNLMAIATEMSLVNCHNGSDGQIIVGASGMDGQYTYSLNGGAAQASNVFSNLAPGTYTATVTGQFGFTATSNTIILENPTSIAVDAYANLNTVTINASGGTGILEYSLNGVVFQSENIFKNVADSVYTVLVRDANGCIATAQVIVAVNTILAAANTVETIACYDGNNGSISVLTGGGQMPYSYQLNDLAPQSNYIFTGLSAGTYTITVRDTFGLTTTTNTITLSNPVLLTATAIADLNVIICTATGGTGVLTYSIDGINFQSGNVFGNLTNGIYQVTVRDANGCTVVAQAEVTIPVLEAGFATTQPITCFGGSDANLFVNATGGVPPYQYSLNAGPFQSGNSFSGLNTGPHTVRIRDAAGTELVLPAFTFQQPTAVEPVITVVTNNASVAISGGAAPYTYKLNGMPNAALTNLPVGAYQLVATDANGCTGSATFTITYASLTGTVLAATTDPCLGLGSLVAQPSGGTPPYEYALAGGIYQPNPAFTNLNAGIYTVLIRDSLGAISTQVTTLIAPPQLVLGAVVVENQITAVPTGGTPPYQYALDGNSLQNDPLFVTLTVGEHILTVTDANNCTATTTVVVTIVGTVEPDVAWGLSIAPNPNNGLFRLSLATAPATLQVTLIDVNGQQLQNWHFTPGAGTFTTVLQVETLPVGMYVLRLTDGLQTGSVRIMIGY